MFLLVSKWFEEFIVEGRGSKNISADVYAPEDVIPWVQKAGEIGVVTGLFPDAALDEIAKRFEVKVVHLQPKPLMSEDTVLMPRRDGKFTGFGIY